MKLDEISIIPQYIPQYNDVQWISAWRNGMLPKLVYAPETMDKTLPIIRAPDGVLGDRQFNHCIYEKTENPKILKLIWERQIM
jgi:hypothetical protein